MHVNNANVKWLVDEYKTIATEAGIGGRPITAKQQRRLIRLLGSEADWTPNAADHLVSLVQNYGFFVLRNALALALALGIEDGELGL